MILTTNSPKYPGDAITLRQNRSTRYIIICTASDASNEIRVSEERPLKIIPSNVTSVNIPCKFQKAAFACTNVLSAYSASPVGRMLRFLTQCVYRNEIDVETNTECQAELQVFRK